MKEIVDRKAIRELAEQRGPCVSLYIPTEPVRRGRIEGRIRLKNQLAEAEDALVDGGMRSTVAKDILKAAVALLGDENFWSQPITGLAIFLAHGFHRRFSLMRAPTARTYVGESFLVQPLLSAVTHPSFYVLALDQHCTRLFKVSDDNVEAVDVPKMPVNIEEVVGADYSEKQMQMHSAGTRTVMHGAGDRAANPKDRVHRFAIAVDRAVTKYLAGSDAALILAADEPAVDIYRKISRYPGLIAEAITGSPNTIAGEALAEAGREIVELARQEQVERVCARFSEQEARFLASDSLDDIRKRVDEGRVGILLTRSCRSGAIPDSEGQTLQNELVVGTLRRGGLVYEVPAEKMPTIEPLAALYRY